MNATNNGADRGAENWKDYQPGKLVVCIEDVSGCRDIHRLIEMGNRAPEKGKIYTVRDQLVFRGVLSIRLVEIVNPVLDYASGRHELVLQADMFRPVKPSRIDCFKRFLADPGKVRSVKSVSPVRYVDGGLV